MNVEMLPRAVRIAGVILLPLLSGCSEGKADATTLADAGAPVDAGLLDAAGEKPMAAPQPSTTATTRAPLELLKLVLTTGVKKKEPVDKLDEVPPGTRVYAHLTLRNRSGDKRKVHVDFLVNGKVRTPLELDVESSWSFRTWGYNTLQAGDKGELEVRVIDETGDTLGAARLPIRAK